jgi:hypothetical protein
MGALAADVSAFASLLFEIMVGRPFPPSIGAASGPPLPGAVPEFVAQIIEDARSPNSNVRLSFVGTVAFLKENRFGIMASVDSDEVSAFVSRVESLEQATERQ